MKLNKIISFVLIISVMLCTCCIWVSAESQELFNSSDPSILSWTNATTQSVNGIGGKMVDDASALISSTDTSGYYQFDNPDGNRWDVSFKGFYVIDFNFFAGENFVGNKIIVTTNWGSSVSCDITSQSAGYREGKWNSVRVIYNSSNVSSSDSLLGVKATYLNGQAIEGPANWWRSYSSPFTVFRVGVFGTAGVNNVAYIDDIRIWKTTEEPTTMTVNFGTDFIVNGESIVMPDGTTLSALKAAAPTYTVTAIRGTTALTNDSTLLLGDSVMVGLPDGSYQYFTVSDGYKLLYNTMTIQSDDSLTQSDIAGCFGKEADDSVKYFSRPAGLTATVNNNKVYTLYEFSSADSTANDTVPYIVSSVDFCLKKPVDKIYLGTRWGSRISDNIETGYSLNEWNRITFVYEPTTETSTYWGNVTVYLNDTMVSKKGIDHATTSNYINQLRICFDNTSDASKALEGYFDNFKVSRQWTVPSAPAARAEIGESDNYLLNGNLIYVSKSLPASEIQNATIYNEDYSSKITGNAPITDGAKIIVQNAEGIFTYYNVKVLDTFGFFGDGYKGNNIIARNNDVTAVFDASAGEYVIVAYYNTEEHQLEYTNMFCIDKSGVNSVELNCSNVSVSKINLIHIQSLAGLKPITKKGILIVE